MSKETTIDFKDTEIVCACGNVFKTASVKDGIKIDVCSKCHPYWAGNATQTAKGGRADKFREKYNL